MALQSHAASTSLENYENGSGTAYRPVDGEEGTSHNVGHSTEASSTQKGSVQNGHEMHDVSQPCSNAPPLEPLLPAKDPDPSTQKRGRTFTNLDSIITLKSRRFRQRFSGWKAGVLLCSAAATAVCLLNLILTIWAATSHKSSGSLSYLYIGNCSKVSNMDLWIHLAINAMSTLLLSASNYTMQIISSPARKEVDIAHQKGRWLDIGIPSMRNLRDISWVRIFTWSILVLSSIPLHLLYNTAIFASTTANAYESIVVSEDFLQPNATLIAENIGLPYGRIDATFLQDMHTAALNGSLTTMNNKDCMARYANNFVTGARNVILVTTDPNYSNNNTFLNALPWTGGQEVTYWWLCGPGWSWDPYQDNEAVCTLPIAQAGADSWMVLEHPIKYCMVQVVEEECKLIFSLSIMIVVIIANATKAALIFLTWWKLRNPTLVTIGDAVVSFLDKPDPTTVGMCLATQADLRSRKGSWKNQGAKRWAPKRQIWFGAVSVKRWLICNILCWVCIILGIVLLRRGMKSLDMYSLEGMWHFGFATVNVSAIIGGAPHGVISTVLFANLPQVILSFLYLTYNSVFSCMLAAHEWSLFATRRAAVRVSHPVAQQRSTYWLQLPYWYAVPLLILSSLLHWLISRSIFVALVDIIDATGAADNIDSISTVGYSCIAILLAIIVSAVAVTAGVLTGFRRYNAGIPLVGNCSAAISAICHRPSDDPSASLLPLKWGCVDEDTGNGIGHCSLSSFEVTAPEDGRLYAGKDKED